MVKGQSRVIPMIDLFMHEISGFRYILSSFLPKTAILSVWGEWQRDTSPKMHEVI